MKFALRIRAGMAVWAMVAALVIVACTVPAQAQMTAFKQALAEAAADDRDIAAFYRDNKFKPIWTGAGGKDRARRNALLEALSMASVHGLPAARYDAEGLKAKMKAARSAQDRAALEVELSEVFLTYARHMQTGVLTPSQVDAGIVRKAPLRDRASYLINLQKSNPKGFFRAIIPQTAEYGRLMKAKMTLEKTLGQGGWGQTVPAKSLKPGAAGNAVVILRNRMAAMGYLKRSASKSYDETLTAAVQRFQLDHGLNADGVAGPATIKALNTSAESRLQSVIVAMERERWLNRPRGKRHVLVNITDFSARVMDNDKETFKTRSVVGKNTSDRQTPEFSDVMEFLVINPTWNVPRSITTKEYLPKMQSNPNAVGHLEVVDSRGRVVPRSAVNFASFSAKTFPYRLRQPPSTKNALGLVKFMFPNKYNIYLHDTPAKNLFGREVRAYSHGCVRLADPFDFAYTLLAKQESNPESYFQNILRTNRETRVDLKEPVPVHIIYRTAFTDAKGRVQYRNDIYGRDARVFNALSRAGVSLRAVRG
ncbi:L,D-transpeptidase family protein [Roseobacteraceae bacterium S113]